MAYTGRMPITSAATSMSRIAIHARPMWPRTRFLATSANDHDERQAEQVLARPACRSASRTRSSRRRRHRARRRVVGEPLHAREQPVDEELRGQRRDREVEALDAQARHAEQHADAAAHQRRRAAARTQQVMPGDAHAEVVGGVGADRHERAGAERDLAAVADQDVEPDARRATGSGTGSGSRGSRYSLASSGTTQEGDASDQASTNDAVLQDREDLLVGARRWS